MQKYWLRLLCIFVIPLNITIIVFNVIGFIRTSGITRDGLLGFGGSYLGFIGSTILGIIVVRQEKRFKEQEIRHRAFIDERDKQYKDEQDELDKVREMPRLAHLWTTEHEAQPHLLTRFKNITPNGVFDLFVSKCIYKDANGIPINESSEPNVSLKDVCPNATHIGPFEEIWVRYNVPETEYKSIEFNIDYCDIRNRRYSINVLGILRKNTRIPDVYKVSAPLLKEDVTNANK